MKHAQKKELIGKYARSSSDTGSPEVQIALLTARIDALTEHLSIHKKDNHSRRGLLGLVQKRRQLKNYLQKTNPEAAKKIADELDAVKGEKKEKIVSNASIASAKNKKAKAAKAKSEDSSSEDVSEKKTKTTKSSSTKKSPAKKASKKK